MNNPKVSVIVPVYNVEKYIRTCIDSILAQTFTDFECIIVDDATPDNSGKICDEYALRDNRIKVIHKEKNGGFPQARKTGLEHSCGYYIQFIDSDDWIEPDMLEKMTGKAIPENLDIAICGCYTNYENGTSTVIKQDFKNIDKINFIKKLLNVSIKTFTCNKLLKRELLMNVDFPIHSRSEDYAIILQYMYFANSIGFIDIPLYHYRFNPLSLSKNKERKIIGQNEDIHNWCLILSFLKSKFTDLSIFEPELSNRINSIYYTKDSDEYLKNKLIQIYPNPQTFPHRVKYSVKLIAKKILPHTFIKFLKTRGRNK